MFNVSTCCPVMLFCKTLEDMAPAYVSDTVMRAIGLQDKTPSILKITASDRAALLGALKSIQNIDSLEFRRSATQHNNTLSTKRLHINTHTNAHIHTHTNNICVNLPLSSHCRYSSINKSDKSGKP